MILRTEVSTGRGRFFIISSKTRRYSSRMGGVLPITRRSFWGLSPAALPWPSRWTSWEDHLRDAARIRTMKLSEWTLELTTPRRIVEVPVSCHKRIGRSKVAGTIKGSLLAGFHLLRTTLRYAWRD